MDMPGSSEFVFDVESTGERVGAVARDRRVLVGTCVVVAIAIVMTVQLVSAPTTRTGTQSTEAASVVLERAAVEGWELLLPAVGQLPTGSPPPMVRTTDRICVGFARLDFGPDDVRPSLARCAPPRADDMAANEIRLLVSIKAGLDTWHFIEAADDIDSIKVHLATGEPVRPERILHSGSTGALQLENDRELAVIEWSTSSATYRCNTEAVAWRTGSFCSDPR